MRAQIIITTLTIILALASCKREDKEYLRKIYFDNHPKEMSVEQSTTLKIKYYPDETNSGIPDAQVVWSSSNSTIISVSNDGTINALRYGKAVIKAQLADFVALTTIVVDTALMFEDNLFLKFCIENFDTNRDGVLQGLEIYDIVGLDVSDLRNFTDTISLTGIEHFQALKTLKITGLSIPNLDLSKNLLLENINCSLCLMEELDLSNNIQLVMLDCHGCDNLRTLKLSKSEDVKIIEDDNGNITYETFPTESNKINIINCYRCAIENLDLSSCKTLEYIDCRSNQLSSLDISNNKLLTQISCSKNNIATIKIASDFDIEQLKTCDIDAGVSFVR